MTQFASNGSVGLKIYLRTFAPKATWTKIHIKGE